MRIPRRMPVPRPAVALALALALAAGLPAPTATAAVDPAAGPSASPVPSVLLVSVDGLRSSAVRELGREGTPVLHRLRRRGASTLNGRTEREKTLTLPNHTGMVTGLRVDASRGGHGVTWNDDRHDPPTVQEAAGHPVGSVFARVHRADGNAALFASKSKFRLFERSWPRGVDRLTVIEGNGKLTRALRRDVRRRRRTFRMLHLSMPDVVGHRKGFTSAAYLDAVRRTDRRIGTVLRALRRAGQAGDTVVIVTSDHGGGPNGHDDATRPANYRVPFLVKGPGVDRGVNLYRINPRYRNPRSRRTTYDAEKQPVRNGSAANLALDLLGIGAVKGSELDRRQDLRVAALG